MFLHKENKRIEFKNVFRGVYAVALVALMTVSLGACAEYDVPGARTVNVPQPTPVQDRPETIDQKRDAVQYLDLGSDVLRPRATLEDDLPDAEVGPYELRSETLAAALQLILADFDIPLAFETEEGLSRRVTISNLKGDLTKVVGRVCGLVNLYCSYEDGLMIVKDTETFAVTLPPINPELYTNISGGLKAITGGDVTMDATTRTMLYTATHRTAEQARYYFERLRSNTALIIFETHIWEVTLAADNNTGINWDEFTHSTGNFIFDLSRTATNITGALGVGLDFSTPNTSIDSVIEFLSTQGAVKTISQPQITLLSGSEAQLTIGGSRDYVSEITRSESGDNDDLSITTDTIETGLSLTITGYLDDSTVYGNLEISLSDLIQLREVSAGGTQIQLPETSDRTLRTQIRVRPGDALLIGGIVTERDNYEGEGVGFMSPFLKFRQSTEVNNTELVFLLKPRVIIYGSKEVKKKAKKALPPAFTEIKPDVEEKVAEVDSDDVSSKFSKEDMDLPPEAKRVVEKTIIQPVIADVNPDLSEITDAVSSEINAARNDVNATRNDVQQTATRVDGLSSEVNAARSEVNAARGDVQQTANRVDGLSSSIDDLKSEVSALKTATVNQQGAEKDTLMQEKILAQLSLLGDRIGLLENNIDQKNEDQRTSLNNQLQMTQSNIDNLNRKLATLEGQSTEERTRYLELKQQSEDQLALLQEKTRELESRALTAEADAVKAKKEFESMNSAKESLNQQEMDELKNNIAALEQKATSAEIEANKMRVLAALEAEKSKKISDEMQQVQKNADAMMKEAAKKEAAALNAAKTAAAPTVTPVAAKPEEISPNPSKSNSLNQYLEGISLDSLAPKDTQ